MGNDLKEARFWEGITMLVALAPLRNEEELVAKKIEEMALELKYDVRKAPFYKDGFKDGFEEGKAEGAAEKQAEMIKKMAGKGISIEIIAETADLDVESIKKIINA